MPDPERILIIRPSALGDVCRSVPVLATLHAAYPDAAIDWLVNDAFAPAIAHHPALNEPVPFPRKELGRAMRAGRLWIALRYLRALRDRRYDLVFDCQGLARSGLLTWATRAPRRIGYANAREHASLGYTERYDVDPDLHSVDRMLTLLEAAGIQPLRDMRLHPPPDAVEWLEAQSWAEPGFLALAPTSRWPGKRWPHRRFADLAQRLLKRDARRIVVLGAPDERDQCRPLIDIARRNDRVVDLVGKTDVGRLLATVSRAGLVVANDSAVVHIAVGFDRPLVALYGPTRVPLVGPYRRENDVIQHVEPDEQADHKDEGYGRGIMERITVQEVEAACLERFDMGTTQTG